jgi:hypothetical protein
MDGMDALVNMDNEEEKQKSFVFVQFAEVGSVVLNVQFENVTPLQVIALAEYLGVKGKNQLVLEENARAEREREMSLAVPSGQGKILIGK